MKSTDLNQRITVQNKTVSRAANGEEIATWGTFATLWACVAPISGREFFSAAQSNSSISYRVTLNYRSDIDRAMRIIYKGQVFQIGHDPINVKSENKWLELMCEVING